MWTGRNKLAKELEEVISGGLASGRGQRKLAQDIADRFGVARWKAQRLVRTECAFVNNLASLKALKKGGASSYKILETLDGRTCECCGTMDGRVYFIDQAVFGKNAPPFHPNCRGCIVAADAGKAGRRGMGKDGQSVVLPGDMTYAEWEAWQKAKCPDISAWTRNRLTDVQKQAIMDVDWSKADYCDAETRRIHEKHLPEYGHGTTMEAYIGKARALLSRPIDADCPAIFRVDNAVERYSYKDNEFVVCLMDGTIKTSFKPKTGALYWRDEYERN